MIKDNFTKAYKRPQQLMSSKDKNKIKIISHHKMLNNLAFYVVKISVHIHIKKRCKIAEKMKYYCSRLIAWA